MMKVREAKTNDVAEINELTEQYGWEPVDDRWMDDVALVAELDGKIVGFVWAMVSKSLRVAYIDYLAADPKTKRVGSILGSAIMERLETLGVERIFSVVCLDGSEFSAKSSAVNLRNGLSLVENPYVLFVKTKRSEEKKSWAV